MAKTIDKIQVSTDTGSITLHLVMDRGDADRTHFRAEIPEMSWRGTWQEHAADAIKQGKEHARTANQVKWIDAILVEAMITDDAADNNQVHLSLTIRNVRVNSVDKPTAYKSCNTWGAAMAGDPRETDEDDVFSALLPADRRNDANALLKWAVASMGPIARSCVQKNLETAIKLAKHPANQKPGDLFGAKR
jgi:hypothetical protein